ncbi:putative dipeptidase [Entomoplasma freundtii]|uniref:Dipeptidase PepV n=1 Tax=Entomoplasma freundtii TaxID=74700 RepID=A0A2K8NTP3_9MOLU|nr:Sapep family Mn(2+)-dependent dipeptidase [Entomoplasma freundtii]ATZ16548.1 dipeptidase PepV [Entomoplasma freundtii]TDY58286.1 putative dipeptidase [Entomoplasma freundtii]
MELKVDVKELMDVYFPQALEATKKLVKIPSFKTAAEPGAPYGKATKEVLEATLALGKELGFETYQDAKNRYGFLDYGDKDKEIFAILCHLDVVPPGNLKEWKTNPFTPIVEDGKLIGRGSFDDKGPTVMNLYALKYLKDHHYVPKDYKIRVIFGLTEETTWESIRAYLADFGAAKMGYVPDGEFPVVYAEKWIVDYDVEGNLPTDFEIHGGEAYNVVDDYVTYKGPKQTEIADWLHKNKIMTEDVEGKLGVKGKAAHGSLPWLGENAATYLGKAMEAVGINNPVVKFLAAMHLNFNLSPLFDDIEDETGKLTQNLGIVDIKNGNQRLAFNYRVPVLTNPKEIFIPRLNKEVESYGLHGKTIAIEDSVYVPKDSPMVTKIMKVYQEVTGDTKAKPLAIGGGTYAKAMPGLVAFGAEFDNEKSTMHAYNEWVSLKDLQKMLEIYTKAIILLTK